MLSYPDYAAKNIIYLTADDSKELCMTNFTLWLKENGKIGRKFILETIFAIFVIGEMTITNKVLKSLSDHGITMVMLSRNLKPYALVGWETEGNVLLRKKQYEKGADSEQARCLIRTKIRHQINLVKSLRDKNETVKNHIVQMEKILTSITDDVDSQSLLGKEGNVSKRYFQAYFETIQWKWRRPRAKRDIPNVLLDIGYTFLFHFIESHMRLYGFDTYLGVYHTVFYQRKSLVCDLMEPWRPIIDRAFRSAYNLGQIHEADFFVKNGTYGLSWQKAKPYHKIFLDSILEYRAEIYRYIKEYYTYVMSGHTKPFPEIQLMDRDDVVSLYDLPF